MGFFSNFKKDEASVVEETLTSDEALKTNQETKVTPTFDAPKEEIKTEEIKNMPIPDSVREPVSEAASSKIESYLETGSESLQKEQIHQDKPNPVDIPKPEKSFIPQEHKAPEASPDKPQQPSVKNNETEFKPAVRTTDISAAETFDFGVKGVDGRSVLCRRLGMINDVSFSDVYITPDRKCFCWGGKTNAGLLNISFSDFDEFFAAIEEAYDGNSSYLLQYKGRNYRVERTVATAGPQFCARKMPTKVPEFKSLGLPEGVHSHLISLAGASGLILLAGATGSGKSTTIASLLKEYLTIKGGYAFTIEDPVELPLDGVYMTPQQELGLCKQTTPPEGSWEEGIKSALRSKPRYIYLGEIRSPDIASEALRAATSGHLVLSSIHANNVNEAINSLVKYAASSGISESMAFELVAGGFLGCIHQILSGAPKRVHVSTLFANPDANAGCQVRAMIRTGKLNMATLIEQQKTLLSMRKPLFTVV